MDQFPPNPAGEQPDPASAVQAPAAGTDPLKAAQEAQQAAEQAQHAAEQRQRDAEQALQRAQAQQAQRTAEQAQQAAEQRGRDAEQQLHTIQAVPPAAPASASAPAAGGESLRRQYANWPEKGDSRAQPWDLKTLGVSLEEQQLAVGAPDTVSPVRIRHSMPIIASGYGGPEVAELARRLALLGIPTDLTAGDNPFNIATTSIMDAVQRFREEYGVEEDPTPFGGRTDAAKARAAALVGPYTWEALIRVSDRVEAAQEAQEAA